MLALFFFFGKERGSYLTPHLDAALMPSLMPCDALLAPKLDCLVHLKLAWRVIIDGALKVVVFARGWDLNEVTKRVSRKKEERETSMGYYVTAQSGAGSTVGMLSSE